MEDVELFIIKPKFVLVAKVLPLIILSAPIWFTIIYSILLGGLTGIEVGLSILLFCVVVYSLVLWIDKKSYEAITYKVYKDRIECYTGIFNKKCECVKIMDIKEIGFKQNLFQKMYNLGTVYFAMDTNNANILTMMNFKNVLDPVSICREIENCKKDFQNNYKN